MYGELRSVSRVPAAWPAGADRRAATRARAEGTPDTSPAARVELEARPTPTMPTYGPGIGRRAEAGADAAAALAVLPRDAAGRVDLERLVAEDDRAPLRAAVEAVALERPAALARYLEVVDRLVARYRDDLSLSPVELESLRRRFLNEVSEVVAGEGSLAGGLSRLASGAALPEALAARVRRSVAEMRERIERHRDDVLTAAGDLGRLLGERVADAAAAPDDARAAGRLGGLLADLGVATRAGSTRGLREAALDRLRDETHRASPEHGPAAVASGREFVSRIGSF